MMYKHCDPGLKGTHSRNVVSFNAVRTTLHPPASVDASGLSFVRDSRKKYAIAWSL